MIDIEPPSVYQNTLHWGVHHQYTIPFKKSIVYSSFPINKSEIIAITSNSIIRLEKSTIKETAPLNLSTAVFIEKQNVIVGVSATTSEFFFIRPYDLSHHITTNVRTKQVPTFHILYSPTSSVLITAGKNIKIWNLKCKMPSRNAISVPPVIEITLRSVFNSSFESDLLNPPLFDYHNEYLILAESTGFNAYNIDCKFVRQMTKLSTSPRTPASWSRETGNIITFESTGGVYEWNTNGTLLRKSIIGSSSVVSCRYLNNSYVIFLDSKYNIYLYDTLAMKFFLCDQLVEKPSSILLYYTTTSFFPTFSICFDNSIDIYEVVMPWRLWRSTMPKPHQIQIYRRRKKAARLLVHTDNEYIYFLSPKTSQTVTSSTPSTPSKILDTFYDRGMDSKQQRDQLFTITYDDRLTIFSTSTVPCTEITQIDNSIASVFECNIENKHYYASATTTGEIIVHDYDTFEPLKRYIFTVDKVLTAKYDDKFSTVLLFYEHEIMRIDISTGNVISQFNLKNVPETGTVFDFKDQLALIGYKSGRISMISVTQTNMVNLAHDGCIFHTMEITGFSISTNFFISVSADQQMKVWSFNGSNILTVTLPLPLYQVEVINAKRDIVVGTEKEIMLIEGRTLFCEKFEPKDDEIDNYNEKNDELSDESSSSLYQLELQRQAMKNAWKENDDLQNSANKGNRKGAGYYGYKKKEMDEETRRRILEKMMKMGNDEFTLNRIREREKKRFHDQMNQIQSEVDKERMKREEAERQRTKQEQINKLIQQQKEELENQRKKQQQQEEQDKLISQKEEEEDKDEKNDEKNKENNEEEEERNEANNNNKNVDDDKNIKDSPSYLKFYESLANADDTKPSQKCKSPKKKKKKKKSDTNNKSNSDKANLFYVDENGNKFRMLSNGDWVDENGKVYHKKADGTFVADDGTVWGGPDQSKGHFETADGTFVSSGGNKLDEPAGQNMPEKWIGPDGKVYYRQPDGRYVAADGSVWDKPMDGSAGGYFASNDGSRPGDTFVDENGNVYTRTSEGWIGPDGKLYRLDKDGRFVADDGTVLDDSKGQLFRQDGYNQDDVYVAPDGTVYKRTPSNRGWIGPDGKIYRLNKDGIFVADDGSVMPLSNERLVWIEQTGINYRPTYNGGEWVSSEGLTYVYEKDEEIRENCRFVCVSGDNSESVWVGPTANRGRFAGKDLFDAPIQWVDYGGNVYKPISNNGAVWVNSVSQTFERQENGCFIEKVDSEEKVKWEGPGKPCDGNWVNNKGQIIEFLGGYWISPDNRIFAATKGGYISVDATLYKPESKTEAFVSQSGEKWNGLGQFISPDTAQNGVWIEANGDAYRPADKEGNWIGPDGEIYSPQPEGHWVGQSSGKVWKGPPFFSARKYFVRNHSYWMQSFHLPNRHPVGFFPFSIGQRPSTPLYKVPPLLYPPFKSRFKAFSTKAPQKKRPRVIYAVPPPNIVVDPGQVVKLIMCGNTQLIKVAQRLGIDVDGIQAGQPIPGAGPGTDGQALYQQQSQSRKSPFQRGRLDERESPRQSSFEGLPRLMKGSLSEAERENERISGSSSLPLQSYFQFYEPKRQQAVGKSPSLVDAVPSSQQQMLQPPSSLPPIQRKRAPLISSANDASEGRESDSRFRPPCSVIDAAPSASSGSNRVSPRAPRISTNNGGPMYSINNGGAMSSARVSQRRRSPLIPLNSESSASGTSLGNSSAFAFSGTRQSEAAGAKNSSYGSRIGRTNAGAKFEGVTRADGFGAKFYSPVPLLNLHQKKDGPSTAVPKTERVSKGRLHTAYLSRAYQLHLEKPQNQSSREIVNPLIVKSMVKPKLSVPQQLFKPKRNY